MGDGEGREKVWRRVEGRRRDMGQKWSQKMERQEKECKSFLFVDLRYHVYLVRSKNYA